MRILIIAGNLLLLTQSIWAGAQPAESLAKFKFVKEIERKKVKGKLKGYAAILEKDGQKYILKQAKGPESKTISNCIIEAISTEIAKSVGISCNDVYIISASDPHHKFYKQRPATLHTFAKGQPIIRCAGLKDYIIKQAKSKKQKKPEDPKGQGLSLGVIKNMSMHPVFSPICAVDTFIGNYDRHRGNLFFEESTQTFTAIDFNASGRINLAAFALKNLIELQQNKTKLEPKIVEALKSYQKTLIKLVKLYPPEKLFKNFEKYALQTTTKNLDKKTKKELDNFYKSYKQFVNETLRDSKKVISIIDKLVKRVHSAA